MDRNVFLLSPMHPAPINLSLSQASNINRDTDKNLIRLNIYNEILGLVEEELNDRRKKTL